MAYRKRRCAAGEDNRYQSCGSNNTIVTSSSSSSTVARRRNGEHGEDPVARQPGAIQTKNVTTQACCCCPDGMAWYDRLNWLISMGPRIYNHVVWSLENR